MSAAMVGKQWSLCFVCFLYALHHGDSLPGDRTMPLLSEQLDKAVDSLQNALNFMQDHIDSSNLDGVIGIRLVEGQLKVLLDHVGSGDLRLSKETEIRLQDIQRLANEIAGVGADIVQHSQPVYFQQLGGLLRPSFWTLDKPTRNVNTSLIQPASFLGEAIHEADSDHCLWELLGTNPSQLGEKCKISVKCWTMMTAPGFKMYSLTHEVFYLQIAELLHCLSDVAIESVISLSDIFCTNILEETVEIAEEGFPEQHKDLFMEQAALCGMSGYHQFFKLEWLDTILSWQREGTNCWGLPLDGKDESISELKRSRSKREERILSDGCQFHRTAVAIGALVQYIRYIVEYSQHFLF